MFLFVKSYAVEETMILSNGKRKK